MRPVQQGDHFEVHSSDSYSWNGSGQLLRVFHVQSGENSREKLQNVVANNRAEWRELTQGSKCSLYPTIHSMAFKDYGRPYISAASYREENPDPHRRANCRAYVGSLAEVRGVLQATRSAGFPSLDTPEEPAGWRAYYEHAFELSWLQGPMLAASGGQSFQAGGEGPN